MRPINSTSTSGEKSSEEREKLNKEAGRGLKPKKSRRLIHTPFRAAKTVDKPVDSRVENAELQIFEQADTLQSNSSSIKSPDLQKTAQFADSPINSPTLQNTNPADKTYLKNTLEAVPTVSNYRKYFLIFVLSLSKNFC